MPANLITYAFTAGELSPQLHGRTDYEKYDLGMAQAQNFFVDYRGGASTRPGTQFLDYIQYDELDVVTHEFQFAPDLANTYLLVFGDGYLRFVQNDGYILEAAKTVTAVTQASPGVITSAAHGFAENDWVRIADVEGMTEINGRIGWVRNPTANTFQVYDYANQPLDTSGFTAYSGGGTVSRVYTVETPYAAADLADLRLEQRRNEARLTHTDYAPRTLTRADQTDWTLEATAFDNYPPSVPGSITVDPSTAGDAGIAITVTAIDVDGQESLPNIINVASNLVNMTTTAGDYKYNWTAVEGAIEYRLYRSMVLDRAVTRNLTLGYIGTATAPEFLDQNIVPDFTEGYPVPSNPFAPGQILYFVVDNPGSGYEISGPGVQVNSATGNGFRGLLIVSESGEVLGVIILNPGRGYTDADTVEITNPEMGTGAQLSLKTSPNEGTNPALSIVHQQRQLYAGSEAGPLTIWGSRVGQYDDFSVSSVVADDDAYTFELDSDEVTPIRHLLPSRNGLLIMTAAGVWELTGNGGAITATNAEANLQSAIGVSEVPPLIVDSDVLYIESVGSTVRLLGYNEYSEVYKGIDVSILSNHLFSNSRFITSWTFAADPNKLVWAVRSDGALLSFTIVKEQEVYGWTQHSTKGFFRDIRAIREGRTYGTYAIVERYLQGRRTKLLEKLASREFDSVEDAWCVDCGLELPRIYPSASLQFASAENADPDTLATASAAVFSAGDVGKVIRGGGAVATVTEYVSTTSVRVDFIEVPTEVLPESGGYPNLLEEGAWTLDEPVSSVSGLWHLEGQTVKTLADGNVVEDQVVTNGTISVPQPASRIIVGLGFRALIKTLSPIAGDAIIEGRRKRLVGTALRQFESRGLKVGASLDTLYEIKERTNELSGRPIPLRTKIDNMRLDASYLEEAHAYYVQDNPLPATILGYVFEVDVGDDPS